MSEKESIFTAFSGDVRPDENEIKGVSIIQVGAAIGHDVFVDKTSLSQVKKMAKDAGRLKAKVDHHGGFHSTIGYFDNFRIRQDKLLADLHVFKSYKQREQLFEMVENIPDQFGVSIFFIPAEPEQDAEFGEVMRLHKLFSADLVDNPAANRDGVFEASEVDKKNEGKNNNLKNAMAETKDTPKLSDEIKSAVTDALSSLKDELKAEIVKDLGEVKSKVDEFSAKLKEQPKADEAPKAEFEIDYEALAEAIVQKKTARTSATAPTAGGSDGRTEGDKPKAYNEALAEYVGDAQGARKTQLAFEFQTQYPNEAGYNAAHGIRK